MTWHEETKSQWEFEALDVDLLTRSQKCKSNGPRHKLTLGAGVKRYMQHEDGIEFEAISIAYQRPNNECPKTRGYTGQEMGHFLKQETSLNTLPFFGILAQAPSEIHVDIM
ncbi:hypothetical protein DFH08DRAFT_816153 [Mycena albidolilacea]|uniref:Uncharacterized protein n=1 Tax=Mycena albidolilacea TaxID=1033008 RepID=A0AAD6ZL32_9AGAR|nr:hypothetical protein DFH08DRAFT_816153 [Mycena albidolilacea]